jgi:hypothetical protein
MSNIWIFIPCDLAMVLMLEAAYFLSFGLLNPRDDVRQWDVLFLFFPSSLQREVGFGRKTAALGCVDRKKNGSFSNI